MNKATEIENRTLTLTRTFDAPRQIVWDAWTQPEHIANWWGPRGMKTTIEKHDFREGGDWKFSVEMPDGNAFISFGTYSSIKAPKMLETSANFIPMTEGVTIIAEFVAVGEQTEFIFRVIHPTEKYCKQQEDMGFYNGWGSVFEGLNTYLKGL